MTTSTDHQGRSFGQKREKGGGADLLAGGDDDGSTLEAQSLGDSESDPLGGCRHDRHLPLHLAPVGERTRRSDRRVDVYSERNAPLSEVTHSSDKKTDA